MEKKSRYDIEIKGIRGAGTLIKTITKYAASAAEAMSQAKDSYKSMNPNHTITSATTKRKW